MSEHTPGPWHWGKSARYNLFAGESTPILYAMQDGEIEVSDADARLISAAPDMLAALKAVASIQFMDAEGDYCSLEDYAPEVAQQVNAAIAKAEGQS